MAVPMESDRSDGDGTRVTDAEVVFSFDEIFSAHHRELVTVTSLLCGDRYEAEDIVAEVFARAYRAHERSPIRQPRAYLRQAAVNETRSRWRKKGVRRRYVEQRRREREPAGMEDRVTEFDRLATALGQLNERQRAAIVMRFYDDLSERATAEALGVPIGTVKSSVARGLARLGQILAEGDDELPAGQEGTNG